jgi:hypothetical protein
MWGICDDVYDMMCEPGIFLQILHLSQCGVAGDEKPSNPGSAPGRGPRNAPVARNEDIFSHVDLLGAGVCCAGVRHAREL